MKLFVIAATLLGSVAVTFLLVRSTAGLAMGSKVLLALVVGVVYALAVMSGVLPVSVAGALGLCAAGLVGAVFGAALVPSRPGLISFLVAASLVDSWSVYFGPTRDLFDAARDGGSNLVYSLAVSVPWDGTTLAILGVGDIFGLGIIFSSFRCQGISPKISLGCGLSAMLLAMVAGLLVGGAPGYVFMAAVAIPVALWSRR